MLTVMCVVLVKIFRIKAPVGLHIVSLPVYLGCQSRSTGKWVINPFPRNHKTGSRDTLAEMKKCKAWCKMWNTYKSLGGQSSAAAFSVFVLDTCNRIKGKKRSVIFEEMEKRVKWKESRETKEGKVQHTSRHSSGCQKNAVSTGTHSSITCSEQRTPCTVTGS